MGGGEAVKIHCVPESAACVCNGVRMIRSAAMIAVLCGLVAAAVSESVTQKLQRIERGGLPHGARVAFTSSELNAWVRDEVPQGVHHPRIVLGDGTVTAYADIDFLALRLAATEDAAGWILRNLMAGERPVAVTVRVTSRDNQARVDVERVDISGVPVEGSALDFLIDNFVRPQYPDVKVGQWFRLSYGVDHVAIHPANVTAVMR